jgi:hypothetical protein
MCFRTLTSCNEECPDPVCPEDTEEILCCRVKHCLDYHELLCQHLKQQEELKGGKWREPKVLEKGGGKWLVLYTHSGCLLSKHSMEWRYQCWFYTCSIDDEARLGAALLVQAVWRGVCARRRVAVLRQERMKRLHSAAVTIQVQRRVVSRGEGGDGRVGIEGWGGWEEG